MIVSSVEGYTFDRWSGSASGTSPALSVTMDSDKNIIAHFKPLYHRLTVQANPTEGGSVSPAAGTTYVIIADSKISATATPAEGYVFTHWSGDASGTENTIVITMDSDKTITANFEVIICNLEVYISPPGSGLVNTMHESFDYGTEVDLVAAPSAGYTFDHWSGDASGTVNAISITMNSDKVITACFRPGTYHLSVYINPPGAGTVTPQSGDFPSNGPVTLTATPAEGYAFSYWAGDASGTSPTITITMDFDKSVSACFRATG